MSRCGQAGSRGPSALAGAMFLPLLGALVVTCQAFDRSEYAALTHLEGGLTDARVPAKDGGPDVHLVDATRDRVLDQAADQALDQQADHPPDRVGTGVDSGGEDGAPEASCPAGDAGMTSLCAHVPAFNGTQIVDGIGTEFCGLPRYVFAIKDGSHAQKPPSTVTATAAVQVAWDTAGFHVFVAVKKWPLFVDPAASRDTSEDAFELFLAPAATDLTASGADPAAIHVVVTPGPGDGGPPAAARIEPGNLTGAGDGGIPLASTSFAVRTLPGTGYDLELFVPWSLMHDAGAPAAGVDVGLDWTFDVYAAGDGGLTRYRSWYGSEADAAGACGFQPPQPYCNDQTWCRPTLLARPDGG